MTYQHYCKIYWLTYIMSPFYLPCTHTRATAKPVLCCRVEAGHMTGFSVCHAGWLTVEVRGSLFSTAESHSSKQRSNKGSDGRVWGGTTLKRRSSWLQRRLALPFPFSSHPEGRQSSASGLKQSAHCDINTEWGWVCIVGVSHRDIHCEVESRAGREEGWDVVQGVRNSNKSISITEFATRLLLEGTVLQGNTLLINTLSSSFRVAVRIGKFHTHSKTAPDGLKFEISSTFFFLGKHNYI